MVYVIPSLVTVSGKTEYWNLPLLFPSSIALFLWDFMKLFKASDLLAGGKYTLILIFGKRSLIRFNGVNRSPSALTNAIVSTLAAGFFSWLFSYTSRRKTLRLCVFARIAKRRQTFRDWAMRTYFKDYHKGGIEQVNVMERSRLVTKSLPNRAKNGIKIL